MPADVGTAGVCRRLRARNSTPANQFCVRSSKSFCLGCERYLTTLTGESIHMAGLDCG